VRPPAGVGDDDDLELEALRGVDREQPHRVRPLLLGDGLELLRPDRLLLAHEADEALDVGPAQFLVRAGEARRIRWEMARRANGGCRSLIPCVDRARG
jgi:hypothetical protein